MVPPMTPPFYGNAGGHGASDGVNAAVFGRRVAPRGARNLVWWLCVPAMALAGCAGVPESTRAMQSTPIPTTAVAPSPSAQQVPAPTPTDVEAGPGTFGILAAESSVRFLIGERLGNSPHRVVGVSRSVIGTVDVNPADAAQAKIGPIQIDAGSFVTDDELRDSSVRAFILQADRYPEIVFTPTSIAGLPPAAEVGDELAFEVTGDLTIRGTTRPVVFEVTLEVQSSDRLLGRAEAAILRSDFGLTIPEVPRVAEVDAEVQLRIAFVAERLP